MRVGRRDLIVTSGNFNGEPLSTFISLNILCLYFSISLRLGLGLPGVVLRGVTSSRKLSPYSPGLTNGFDSVYVSTDTHLHTSAHAFARTLGFSW